MTLTRFPGPQEAALRRALSGAGLRFTRQRAEVYAYLCGTDQHPTAQEIYENVRGGRPAVSLATVYKTLEALVGCGLVARVALELGPTRFDARTEDHGHSRCLGCGAIRDLPDLGVRAVLDAATAGASFVMTHFRMEVVGLCDTCRDELPCLRCARASTCRAARLCEPVLSGEEG